jgi:hypothetical protein
VVAAIAGLVIAAPRTRPTAVLLLAFVAPVVLVLALAARNPKFNPRYLMLVSPAYLLLLAGGAAAWFSWAARRVPWAAAVPAAILAPPLLAALIGIQNWYTDPAFTKAQWREAADYVRSHAGANERVVLVSGHAAPAWNYYAPDLSPLRLPSIDILDVNAVLGFDSGAALAEGLAGKGGAWLITWQDEVVDPVGFTPYFLDRAGEESPTDRAFWHLGVRHWRLDPDARFAAEPEPQHTQTANFDHKLELSGWDEPVEGELTVYWRALNTLTEDYQVSLLVEDAMGNEVGRWDGRPAAYVHPTPRWQVGEVVFGRYPLPIPAGAQGPFTVALSIYAANTPDGLDLRDVADNPAGKRVRLGPMESSIGR